MSPPNKLPRANRPAAVPAPARGVPDASPVAVLRKFRLVFSAVRGHFLSVQRRTGVTGAQLWALSVIGSTDAITVGGLARAMDVHQTTASNLVRALAELAFVVTERSASDRRSVILRLTPAGARVLRRAPGPVAGVLPQALSRLDPVTLARLDHDLAQLLRELDVDERAAQIPLAHM